MDKWKNRWPLLGPVALCLILLCLIPRDGRRASVHSEAQEPAGDRQGQWLVFEPEWAPELEEPEVGPAGGSEVGTSVTNSSSSTRKSFISERDSTPQNRGPPRGLKRQQQQQEDEPPEEATRGRPQNDDRQPNRSRRRRRFSRTERKPILNEFSFPANLVQGMRFVLMCQVLDGESPIQIKWFKDNEELISAPDSAGLMLLPMGRSPSSMEQVELVSNDELGASLLFRRVLQQHSGNYTCLATNQFGSTSYSSFMSVKVPPSWKVEPQDQHSIMGDQITIDCQATGNPNPFIRWKFTSVQHTTSHSGQAEELHDVAGSNNITPTVASLAAATTTTNFKLINSNHHVQTLENGSLAIRQAQREHEGLYLCEADNGVEPGLVKALRLVVHQQAQFADELQVIDPANLKPALAAGPPSTSTTTTTQLVASRSVRLALGTSQLRLLCQPMGDPPLTLEWLKDGQTIYTHTTPGAADLSLQQQQQQQQLATTARQQQQRAYNESLYHVSTHRNAQRPQVALDSELVLTNVRRHDAGLFTCAARNAFGQSERRLRVVVQEPPEPPEMVDVAHIGSRSIALRWLAPAFDGNSPIVKYTVEYRRQQPDHPELQDGGDYTSQSDKLMVPKLSESMGLIGGQPPLPAQQQQPSNQQQQQVQHTVHELEPLASYSMRVVAVNTIGRSRPSVALSLRTDEEVPSVVPSLVEALVLSSKSIKLRWSISYSPAHEIIDGFFVGYRSLDSASNQAQLSAGRQPPSSADQPTFTYKTIRLTNQQQQPDLTQSASQALDLATDYGTMNRVNQLSQSDASSAFLSPVSSVTKTLPGPTVHPFALHQATLSSSSLSSTGAQQVVVVSAFEYVINGLDRNTEYSILIQCFNRKGAGPTSDPVVFKTFMNDPPEKLILATDEIKESSLRLSWRFINSERFATPNAQPKSQEPVDGFVLTFAKVSTNTSHQNKGKFQSSFGASDSADQDQLQQLGGGGGSSSRAPSQPAARISNQQQPPPVDQWQAVQLSPQQRNHQLNNLECGTSYVMKIWAFNKIGNGDASDLIRVKTQGKAPIAPEKRAFISVNSTQLRLHLSAWYDGGCEIDKFMVQYRLRGQAEWLLVSNNILKEQASVVIRDLLPATSYEILVAAHNQVATTEARYRVVTLDADGKPVSHSFLGNLPSLGDEDDEQGVVDYNDPDGVTRRWPHESAATRSLALFRHLLSSPMALILSLCLFVALVMVLLVYKFNSAPQGSSSSLNSNKSSASGGGRGGGGHGGSCDATATMLDGETGHLSLTNDSPNESPRMGALHLSSGLHSFQQQQQQQQLAPESDCQYQSFCPPASYPQQQPVEYGRSYRGDDSPYPVAAYGTYAANYSMGHYGTSVQRNGPADPGTGNAGLASLQADNSDGQRQCLMQMLMMGPQQQQLDASGSYAAALTTMARGNKSSSKQMGQNHIQSPLANNSYMGQGFAAAANTLGRHAALDYQRLQQQQQQPSQQLGGFSAG